MIGNKGIRCQVLRILTNTKAVKLCSRLLLASSRALEGEKSEPILTQFARYAVAEQTF